MGKPGRVLLLSIGVSLSPLFAWCQDGSAPSLGDLARQTRQQKENNAAQGQPRSATMISDEDAGAPRSDPGSSSKAGRQVGTPGNTPAAAKKTTAEQWKAAILEQEKLISSTQANIDRISQSIQFHNSDRVRWNEYQREKQQEVEKLQTQLAAEKKRLEEMRDGARKQGYGNTVYDP